MRQSRAAAEGLFLCSHQVRPASNAQHYNTCYGDVITTSTNLITLYVTFTNWQAG